MGPEWIQKIIYGFFAILLFFVTEDYGDLEYESTIFDFVDL